MLIISCKDSMRSGEVQSPDPIFNLCIKKSLHFKLKISLIINLLDLYDKIRLCSGDYSHSDKQSSEIVGHTEEEGPHSGPIYYTLNYNLLEESHDKSALVNVSSAPN